MTTTSSFDMGMAGECSTSNNIGAMSPVVHQLPADQGAPQELLLNSSGIHVELKTLMEGRASTNLDSSGLGLHVRGLMNVLSRSQVQYSSEAVRDAMEVPR